MSIELRDGTNITDGRYVVNAICRNCREWKSGEYANWESLVSTVLPYDSLDYPCKAIVYRSTHGPSSLPKMAMLTSNSTSGSVDFNSRAQPMIYAIGPDSLTLNTDAKDAGLRKHTYHGSFTMDLLAAKGDPSQFPPNDLSNQNAMVVGQEHHDREYVSSGHALLMTVTFVAILPSGVFCQTVFKKFHSHLIIQSSGVVTVLIGAGLGLGMSHYYNRSRNFSSAHQMIGIMVLALILLQTSFGVVNYMFIKAARQHTVMGIVHRYMGPALIVLGIINGG
ncbi:MAG: hypothetical protein Q9174_001070, partial [Haloplaca sp. 1 TL-2023]